MLNAYTPSAINGKHAANKGGSLFTVCQLTALPVDVDIFQLKNPRTGAHFPP